MFMTTVRRRSRRTLDIGKKTRSSRYYEAVSLGSVTVKIGQIATNTRIKFVSVRLSRIVHNRRIGFSLYSPTNNK